MAYSDRLPIALKAKSTEELQRAFAKIQVQAMAQLKVVSIYFDGTNHILWYYPPGGSSSVGAF